MRRRFALAQINPTVGDLAGNAELILDRARQACQEGAHLMVTPELALTGYLPEDLLLEPQFLQDTHRQLKVLAQALPRELPVMVGTPLGKPGALFNAAVVLWRGHPRAIYRKVHLPNYGVFDEKRYFSPGRDSCLLDLGGVGVGVTICEDIWVDQGPAKEVAGKGAQVILNLSSSPYHAGKWREREALLKKRARESRAYVLYCNLVGGQDELVFDGGSFAVTPEGRLLARGNRFEETLLLVEMDLSQRPLAAANLKLPWENTPPSPAPLPSGEGFPQAKPQNINPRRAPPDTEEDIYQALLTGTRDYVKKNNFKSVVIGLSGGVDSALVACIAADALGCASVTSLSLPTRYNSAGTRQDAREVARRLNIPLIERPIQRAYQSLLQLMKPLFAGRATDVTEENMQSRLRGLVLMSFSNKTGALVLTTGNKSETSVGYTTLYGDTAGGFAPIKDVPKHLVYALARWRNRAKDQPFPESLLRRAPSAELRPHQRDQDTLPSYDQLDRLIHHYVENSASAPQLQRLGIPLATVKKVVRLVDLAEYKRRQSPPGVKITPRAFGRDRRMPITNHYQLFPGPR